MAVELAWTSAGVQHFVSLHARLVLASGWLLVCVWLLLRLSRTVQALWLWCRLCGTFVTGQVLNVLRQRRSDGGLAPRPGSRLVSAEWLTSVLRASGTIDVDTAVQFVLVHDLVNSRGLAGDIVRLRLQYTGHTGSVTEPVTLDERRPAGEDIASADAPPATLILKRPRAGPTQSLRTRLERLFARPWAEARFYAEFGARLAAFLPRVHHAQCSPWTGEGLVLLEDLRGCIGVNQYLGNQIWGALPQDRPREPVRVLHDVFLTAADLHATFWCDERLLRRSWLKGAAWYRQRERIAWEMSVEWARRSWRRVRRGIILPSELGQVGDRVAGAAEADAAAAAAATAAAATTAGDAADAGLSGTACKASPAPSVARAVRWSPYLVRVMDESLRRASWPLLQRALSDRRVPFTLTHGDYHAANLLWRPGSATDADAGQLLLIDWSEVGLGEPTADLGQLMISDVPPPLRRSCERALVQAYWSRLVQRGVPADAYPLEQCWSEYGRSGVERWIVLFALLAGMALPARLVQYFHDQLLAFMEDHGAHPWYTLKGVVYGLPR